MVLIRQLSENAERLLLDNGIDYIIQPLGYTKTIVGALSSKELIFRDERVEIEESWDNDYYHWYITLPCGCVLFVGFDYRSGSGGTLYVKRPCEKHIELCENRGSIFCPCRAFKDICPLIR